MSSPMQDTVLGGLYPPQEEQAILRWLAQEHLPADEYAAAVARLRTGEPLQYVLGKAWFYGRDYNVGPAVLIPRQETELLVDVAVKEVRKRKMLHPSCMDLCTGSGCIAWSIALECPGAAVSAVDVSDDALAVASSQPFDIPSYCLRPTFEKADVLRPDAIHPGQRFDVILSNPPYVRDCEAALMHRNVLEHEPHLALFVPDADPLLFYRAVAEFVRTHLSEGGFGIVEINEAFPAEVEEIFRKAGCRSVRTILDFCDKPRHVFFEK